MNLQLKHIWRKCIHELSFFFVITTAYSREMLHKSVIVISISPHLQ